MPDLNLIKIQSSYSGQTPSTGKEVEDAFNQNFETVEKAINKYDVLDLNMFSNSGYINKNTGEVTSGNSYVNTGFMPVISATDIVLTGFDGANGGAQALCAFYNKYKTYINTYTTGAAGDTTVTIPASSFPEDAYYIRCTARAAQATRAVKISFAGVIRAIADSAAAFSSTFYNVTQNNPLPFGQFYNFDSARLAIPADLRRSGLVLTYAESATKWVTMQFQGTTASDYTNLFTWFRIPDFRLAGQCMFIYQGYSNRFTGAFVNDSSCIRTAPIPLNGLSSFSFMGTNGIADTLPSGACNFFDKDMNFIDTYTVYETGNLSKTVSRSNFPENAAFAVVSALKTDRYQTDFVLGNFGESIAGILELIKELDSSVNNSLGEIAGALNALDTALRTAINAVASDLNQRLNDVDETATTGYNLANQANESAIDNAAAISDVITEVNTLQDEKVDNGYWEDGFLYLTSNGVVVSDPIEIQGGGGGGGGGSVLRLQNLGSASIGVAEGETVILRYAFSSLDSETNDPTGDGTAAYYVNSVRVFTQNIAQGENLFDITSYLSDGLNTVRIQVTDSYGAIRSLNIRITVISIKISSTFNDSLVYHSQIDFPYTPVGAGEKVIHFIVDGNELTSVTTSASNRQLTYRLPNLSHGAHSVQVFAKMMVDGIELTSNILNYSIIYAVEGNDDVIISSSFIRTEATQYDVLAIPYSVYNPHSAFTTIQLKANDTVVSEQLVDSTRQTWSYRIPDYGPLTLEIVAGSASRIFNLDIAQSPIDSEAETEGLELYLTSNGRSNNELNPEEWTYNDIEASLTGFNFITNGWVLDGQNVTVLRVSAGATVNIPFKPFQADFRGTGKTIEFDFATRDVENYNAILVNCMSAGRGFQITAQEVIFASELSRTTTQYKDNEHVRISFVVENTLQNRLLYTYINGIMSGVIQYAENDNFAQNPAVNIIIGSAECTIDIYNIRSYATFLNEYQILNNYIADIADVSQKLAVYDRNQIYDSSGDIVYSLLLQQLPCMTITGSLPTYKGDKKTVSMVFENVQHPERSFTAHGVEIDVQGTSSQYYPRKNFKHKFKAGLTLTETGEFVNKYKLNEAAIPVSTFCEKADFAESAGTHNTGMARYVDFMLRQIDVLTPPQQEDPLIRSTVDGYPIAIFHRESETSPILFVGKYNFNNDKSTQETFGLSGIAECWEFLNNTSDRSLFLSDDFSGSAWMDDFEGRYPDPNEDPTNLQVLFSWVVSCIDNPAKFKNEFAEHFNQDNILSYYILTEFFGMVDQRAKNMFLTSWGNEGSGAYKWRFIFYDNDTLAGINNEGLIAFGYNIETHDQIGSGYVWNGHNSALWQLVEDAFPDELAAMYVRLRQSGAMNYENASLYFNDAQASKWCEVVYNLDGRYKYIQPLIESGIGTYLYAAQGSRLEHRKWWLSNRFNYMDSKYNAANFLNDFVVMRLYTPMAWTDVEPNADFVLTPYDDSYLRVKYGSYIIATRAEAGVPVTIQAPAIQFNDTETIIYGASAVKGLGDLSAKYAGTVDISNAKKLNELIIGSDVAGYDNKNLHSITLGNNTLLKKLDVRNCSELSDPIDISGCENIEEIYATGTALTSVILPPAGNLKKLTLPATIANLTIRNQPILEADLIILGNDNISTLVLENLSGIDIWQFALNILQNADNKLERVRLIGINVSEATVSELMLFENLTGLNENNITTAHAVLTGSIHFDVIGDSQLIHWNEIYPDLMITYDVLDQIIVFEDPVVKEICVENWDTNGDGELSTLEAEAVTILSANIFTDNTEITKFNELRFFTKMATINSSSFSGCSSLQEITIPQHVTNIFSLIFEGFSGSIIFESETPPNISSNTFSFQFYGTIYVPDASLSAYISGFSTNYYATGRIKAISEKPE